MGVDNLVKVTNQQRPIATGKIQSEKERKKVSALFPRLLVQGLQDENKFFFFLCKTKTTLIQLQIIMYHCRQWLN